MLDLMLITISALMIGSTYGSKMGLAVFLFGIGVKR